MVCERYLLKIEKDWGAHGHSPPSPVFFISCILRIMWMNSLLQPIFYSIDNKIMVKVKGKQKQMNFCMSLYEKRQRRSFLCQMNVLFSCKKVKMDPGSMCCYHFSPNFITFAWKCTFFLPSSRFITELECRWKYELNHFFVKVVLVNKKNSLVNFHRDKKNGRVYV